MDLDGCLPLAVPVVVGLAARPLSGLLPPRTATWLLTATGALLALTGTATLALLALAGALRLPLIAALADLSQRVLHRDDPTSPPVAAVAGALTVAALVAAVRTAVREARALRAAARTARDLPGDGLVSVVEDAGVEAFALPGRPGRVVVTTGMLALLTEPERRVLLAHERAHLAGGHHLFRAVVRVASAANPVLWPLRAAVTYTTERWADERAAATAGDRRRAARAIGKAALAAARDPGRVVLGIGAPALCRRRTRPGPVPRRVAALLAPPPPRRHGLVAAVALLAVLAVTGVQDRVSDLHQVIHRAREGTAQPPR
ncbi:Peptidase family M48 [Actinomadura rubteroloni]|uniref:Peptidase family M48 n=1 Tax=Actinomadura rubteroloni TaxID=1926885 RepID=A0A2P4UM36_9ACTN|nr:M56 family metallopeptidase [Actinomadura rubteroloni]POM26113.1 Peptidase family M48 [Actinomadura rubteroloni]